MFEAVGPHALVFPQYILDPSYGYHAERARGPFVEATANGVGLYAGAVAAAVALASWRGRGKAIAAAVLTVCALGLLLTLTRSVWVATVVATALTLAILPGLRRFLLPAAVGLSCRGPAGPCHGSGPGVQRGGSTGIGAAGVGARERQCGRDQHGLPATSAGFWARDLQRKEPGLLQAARASSADRGAGDRGPQRLPLRRGRAGADWSGPVHRLPRLCRGERPALARAAGNGALAGAVCWRWRSSG